MTKPGTVSVSNVVLNEDEHPRILILVDEYRRADFEFLEKRPGTHKFIRSLEDVDFSEWDLIILDRQAATANMDGNEVSWWHRQIPLGLNVMLIHDPEMPTHQSSLLDGMVVDPTQRKPSVAILERTNIPGKHATRVDGLPEQIQSLVGSVLVPLMNIRSSQFGHQALASKDYDESLEYRPFVIGPKKVVIAGSYARSPNSNAWILPCDIDDFEPWLDVALSEWHSQNPVRFPSAPSWLESPDWATAEQASLADKVRSEDARFAPLAAEHASRLAELAVELEEATSLSLAKDLQLLAGQGDPLQEAVRDGLRLLGFGVRDMDLEWPERERREDFRITDPDDPTWLAIGDATGVAKGAKGTKLTALAGFAAKYILEERPEHLPSQWLIVNHFLDRDPNARPALLRSDDAQLFAANQGLAIDSAALFLLVQAAKRDGRRKRAMRSHLRVQTGQFLMKDAREWLAGRGESAD